MKTFEDLRNYFANDIPHSLGLMYPEANGKIAGMIIDEELKNNDFLPGEMPARDRAEFAIPDFGGYAATQILDLQKAMSEKERVKIFATKIILNHRLNAHAKTQGEKLKIKKEIESLDEYIESKGIVFNEKEKELLISTMGFWGPD